MSTTSPSTKATRTFSETIEVAIKSLVSKRMIEICLFKRLSAYVI
jgi:hypothetical protein